MAVVTVHTIQGAEIASLDIPDAQMVEAHEKAAEKNVLASMNPTIFPGYWSVCADGQGFGYGNTYPSLDEHQMTDALPLFHNQPTSIQSRIDSRGLECGYLFWIRVEGMDEEIPLFRDVER